MTHTYNIQGMTCNGCRSHVKQILSEVDGVTNASVSLEKKEAVIVMDNHIETVVFQKVLPEKYTLSDKKEINTLASKTQSTVFIQEKKRANYNNLSLY